MQKFIENITIRDLNPHNCVLGNDFQDNLWTWGIQILPELSRYVMDIKVMRCFASEKYIKDVILKDDEKFNWEWKKFAYGLAIKLTWNDWSFENASLVSNAIFDGYQEDTHCIIDERDKSLTVYRRMRDKKIRQRSNEGMKTIRDR